MEAGLDSGQKSSGCWQNLLFAVIRLRSHLLTDCHPELPSAPRGCSWAHWLSPSLLFQGWQQDPLCKIPFMLSVSLTLSSATSGRKPSACKGRSHVTKFLPSWMNLAGLRKDRGTRDQIANIFWIIEKSKGI